MNRFNSRLIRMCTASVSILLVAGVASAKVVTETWQVQGVHNASDQAKIREALTKLPTVTQPMVDMSTVKLTFDDAKVTRPDIEQAIAKAGNFKLMNQTAPHAHPTAAGAKPHK